MKRTEKISNAIGNIDERFLQEVMEYRGTPVAGRWIRRAALVAAGLCLAMGCAALLRRDGTPSVKVYAREFDRELPGGETVMMSGTIDDNGVMKGPPLMFYVQGSGIESIRFACRNEWISFVDYTEQREDHGYSKNFTIPYGEKEEDYYYMVVDWEPVNVIRKLTDNKDVKIADLTPEEKEDVIIMEVSYLNGERESLIMNVCLDDRGRFMVSVSEYEITPSDTFLHQPNTLPTDGRTETPGTSQAEQSSVGMAPGTSQTEQSPVGAAPGTSQAEQSPVGATPGTEVGDGESATVILSEEGFNVAGQAVEDYYASMNRRLIAYVQADDRLADHLREQEEFDGEIVVFRVSVEGSEAARYIVLGSQDGWEHCTVLNEGY